MIYAIDMRYVCVHGHFYQPPRENPWLEAIEPQESAYPYPNWNDRILSECYRPNAAARIVGHEGRIAKLVNNYSLMSFNFGPTLLSWLQTEAPDVYQAILDADKHSMERFSGHGSAMAQVYNHPILPLCNARDRYTQVYWGIEDFRYRFGRNPEGMWLPETGVDADALEMLASQGIRFTVLAPHQAARIRPVGTPDWQDVSGNRVPTHKPYRVHLPSGKSIAVFFYDGGLARAVAFERLLGDGQTFANRLIEHAGEGQEPRLSHIATDGESYGHHHRHGDMALAYALSHIDSSDAAKLTNYGEFLELCPPSDEAEIFDNTAWSCAHGLERWASDCGCHSGAHPDWSQQWRKPLRAALDWLRDAVAEIFSDAIDEIFSDPWQARNAYIQVVLDRNANSIAKFLAAYAVPGFSQTDQQKALMLLEMQRHSMLMYTSCGWFFDDVSGTEAVQVLAYAARVIELAEEMSERSIFPEFLTRLALGKSNIPAYTNGREVFEKLVIPMRIELSDVVSHYAVQSLFRPAMEHGRVYSYQVTEKDSCRRVAGRAKLSISTLEVVSETTMQSTQLSYAALHLGDHNLTGAVRHFRGDDEFRQMTNAVTQAFDCADLVVTQQEIEKHFGELSFSLHSLFRMDRDHITEMVLERPTAQVEQALSRVYQDNVALMRFLTRRGAAIPPAFLTAAKFAIHLQIRRALEQPDPDLKSMRLGFAEAETLALDLDTLSLEYAWQGALERVAKQLAANKDDVSRLNKLTDMAKFATNLDFPVDLWRVQNVCYGLIQSTLEAGPLAGQPDAAARDIWIRAFVRLADTVFIDVPTALRSVCDEAM